MFFANDMKTVLAIILVHFCWFAQAQKISGMKLGVTNYQGDLVLEDVNIGETRVAIGFFYQQLLTRHWGAEVGLNYLPLAASDWNYAPDDGTGRYQRGIQMRNRLLNTRIKAYWYPWMHRAPIFPIYEKDRNQRFQPFIGTGIELNYNIINIKDLYHDNGIQEYNPNKFFIAIPMTIGFRNYWHKRFAVGMEWSMVMSPSDLGIDGFNHDNNSDYYHFLNFGFSYTFL